MTQFVNIEQFDNSDSSNRLRYMFVELTINKIANERDKKEMQFVFQVFRGDADDLSSQFITDR